MITIKKNPETVGKLKVGTTAATPADGDIVADKVGVGTVPIADSKLDIAGAGTQRLYVRETGSTVKTKLLTTTSKGAVGTETNHPLELQTNDQTRVTVDSTGAVTVNETAISTTNAAKLEVRSDADGSTSAIRTTNKDVTAGTNQAAGVDFGLSRNSGAFKPQAGQIKVGREADWSASDTNIDSYMAFSTYANNALGERMRISSTGAVKIAQYGELIIDKHETASGTIRFYKGGAASAYLQYDASENLVHYLPSGTGEQRFYTGGGLRLTIDSSGNVNISGLAASSDVQTDGSKNLITSSDKRLKNDIGELTAGLDIISNLKPHYFSWKSDETNTQQLGFYAQDVYEFLPEAAPREQKQNLVSPAVSAEPATYYEEGDELPEGKAVGDEKTPAVEAVAAVYEPATNEDGTPDYNWGFNGRPIIAALVAAVKELKAKVEALENA